MVFAQSERAPSGRGTHRHSNNRGGTVLRDVSNSRHRASLSSLSSPLVAAASQRVKEAQMEADRDQLFEVEAQTAKWLARRRKLVRKKIPSEERERLVELFDALDTDGGGTINLSEFRQAFRMMLDSDHNNHDGTSGRSSKSSKSMRDNGRRGMMRAAEKQFKAADVDGNGEMDPDEFVKLMTELEEASCGELGTTAENLGALLKAAANALRFRRYVTRAMQHTTSDDDDDDDGNDDNISNYTGKENPRPGGGGSGGGALLAATAKKKLGTTGYIGEPGVGKSSWSTTTPLSLQPRTPQSQRAVSSGSGITTPSSSSSLPAAASVFSTLGRWRESTTTPSSSLSSKSPSLLSSLSKSRSSSQSGRRLRATPSPVRGGGGGVSPNVVSSTMTEMENELAKVEQALELASARRNDTWQTRTRGRTPTPTGSRGQRGGAASADDEKKGKTTPQPRCQSATPTLPRLVFSPSPSSPSPVISTTSAPLPSSGGLRRSVRSSSARARGSARDGGSRARWH